uniref:nucleotidyltransferase domain-containing protein n=1 Tax=Minwuia thermotolerans TaxID=2056226 RepID=UPI000D6DC503
MATLRNLGPGFDPAVVAGIDAKLREVEATHNVRILLAIESGSRGWGFASPDSDYDCRFIFVRPRDDYLSLFPKRDVIEYPPDGIYDVNGWDLPKALKLLLKGNAVVIEWLTSPYAYAGDSRFRDELLALAREVVQPAAIANHYLHLGERQYRRSLEGRAAVSLKKVFYALRPAIALRWMRHHPGETVAPMAFGALVDESGLPGEVQSVIDELLARKAETREMGEGEQPASIANLIEAEFGQGRDRWPASSPGPMPGGIRAADLMFRRW